MALFATALVERVYATALHVQLVVVGLQLLTVTHVVVFATVSCSTSKIVPS